MPRSDPPAVDRIDAGNQRLIAWGKTVYADHRVACHGSKLEGQPGWRRCLKAGALAFPIAFTSALALAVAASVVAAAALK